MSQPLKADRSGRERWAEEVADSPARDQPPTTASGRSIEPLYTPEDLDGFDAETDLGFPGQYHVCPRRTCDHVSLAPLDHAAVRRLRHPATD